MPIINEVKLKVNSKEFVVQSHKFRIFQNVQNSRPFGKVFCDTFYVKVESNAQDNTLFAWAKDDTKQYSGSIDFIAGGSIISQLVFENAYCVSYSNQGNFVVDAQGGGQSSFIEEITIICDSFKWGTAEYKS